MKLFRLKDTSTGKFYKHRIGCYSAGDWVDEESATIWTKQGGINGALGAVREKARQRRKPDTFVVESVFINPSQMDWK